MRRTSSLSRKEFLAKLAVLLAGVPLLGGVFRTRKGRGEAELKEADYYAPHSHGG